tara:strand:- start:6461 stop:9958 length:3498 start_codon:yes stop_codon:yes gene_type:complete
MDKRELQKLLNQPYEQENWKEIVQFVFPNVSILAKPIEHPVPEKDKEKIKRFLEIGNVRLHDGKNLALFEVLLTENVNLKQNRVRLNDLIANKIDHDQAHGVLSVFEQGDEDYRFTFAASSNEFDEEEGDFVQKRTDTKRFTYLLGKNESCKTPAERFYELSQHKADADIQSIQAAFSVEQLSKEFFDKYKKQFEIFWTFIAQAPNYRRHFVEHTPEKVDLKIRDFTKKLLGRIVFLHFLQKKGWMGCDASIDGWESGDKKFMQNLFKSYEHREIFHSQCLSVLFYDTLNKKRDNDIFSCDSLDGKLNNSKVPYLNGGLFDSDELESKQIDFPSEFFEGLFDFFGQYNFTIDENDPNDHEVGIDPEMLGHIFENLLEDNKDKGAFYTPKVIVQYMCQESIIEYLATKLDADKNEAIKTGVEALVRNRLAEKINELDLVEHIAQALFDVKICDPAIGSGAFPMGILNVIYQVVEELHCIQPDAVARTWGISDAEWQPHLVKKNIIQHSIYGVDIEAGAVDIARLRFWLALVVDEVEPLPLPNLDYKIMQGNSLLESFEGIDLSQIGDESAYEIIEDEMQQVDLFSGQVESKVKVSLHFEDVKELMDQYFNANEPYLKKYLHQRIDEQVLNHIKFSLLDSRKALEHKIKLTKNALRAKESDAHSAELKIQIRTLSNEAKKLRTLEKDLEALVQKELKLAKISTSNERPFFLWHLFFQEVFENGGFDIVIANPPYVEFKNLEKSIKNLLEPLYTTLSGKYDLYIAFIELYVRLLNHGGVSTSIHPTRFMQRDYGTKAREFLALNTEIRSILDFVDKQVFENALAYTGIFLNKKIEKRKQLFTYRRAKSNKLVRHLEDLRVVSNSENFENIEVCSGKLSELIWVFQSESTQAMFNKMLNNSIPLSELLDGVYQGIATGKDDVFLLDENQIILAKLERNYLKPFLKGKDISPFKISFKDKFVIYPYDENGRVFSEAKFKNEAPNLYEYLIDNRDKLKGRGYFEKSNKIWYELWNQRNPKRFEQKKIVTLDNAKKNSFAFDKNNYFGSTTVYNLILKNASDEFYVELLLILNSKLLNFYHSKNTVPQAGGYLRYQAIFINNLPIKFGLSQDVISAYINDSDIVNSEKFLIRVDLEVLRLYEIDYEHVQSIFPELAKTINKTDYQNSELLNR